ncbi:hypothetical protein ACRBEV_24940 [Methylobacterium phyllosphaerae]
MIVIDLPEPVAITVETMAAKVGMTASAWLGDQIEHAYGNGRVSLINPEKPRRQSRSTPRRHAAARRAARAARAVITETPENV